MTPDGTEGRAVLLLRDRVKPAQVYIPQIYNPTAANESRQRGACYGSCPVLSRVVATQEPYRARARGHLIGDAVSLTSLCFPYRHYYY